MQTFRAWTLLSVGCGIACYCVGSAGVWNREQHAAVPAEACTRQKSGDKANGWQNVHWEGLPESHVACILMYTAYTLYVRVIISLICQVGSNKRKIQIKYKIQNKQTTMKKKHRACKHTDKTH